MLKPEQVEPLLYDLCVKYGFCLHPDDQEKLTNDPRDTIDGFTDAVYLAEGADRDSHPKARRVYELVRARVAEAFAQNQ